jgi:hypothetical protein
MGEVEKQLVAVEADTTELRGLKARADVPEHFMSPAQMKADLVDQTVREYTPEQAKHDATVLWLLMFIDDPTIDFLELEKEFAGESILGYYDHEKKELFVKNDSATLSPDARMTLSHEFVHALQDQHFDLMQFLPREMEHDRAMARRALVEGDATVSGLLYAHRYMNDRDYDNLFSDENLSPPIPGRAPIYLQEAWQFPYLQGTAFILSLAEPGSFKAIDRVYADPPSSSEQIMHPEKYLETPRDEPLEVTLPPLAEILGPGWDLKESDTLGEFDLSIMLRENFIEQPEASEGWGGARYDFYRNGASAVAILGTRWDSNHDSAEFMNALEQSFKLFQKSGDIWNDSRRAWGLTRLGDMVVFVSGSERAAVEKVMGTLGR